ncbi:MAG: hypothetical protein KJ767_00750 [Nanoarchaeota archaeon]|nr:hypothetical protein [Nanoarchaeota archaeon]
MERKAKNFESVASVVIRNIQDAFSNFKWKASVTNKIAFAQTSFLKGRILNIRLDPFQDRELVYAHASIGINNRVFANHNFRLEVKNQNDIRTSANIISNWIRKKLVEKQII